MKLNYTIGIDDYIDFNFDFLNSNKKYKNNRLINRFIGPVIFLAVAIFLFVSTEGYVIHSVVYTILAIVWFLYYPKFERNKIQKNFKKLLSRGDNTVILGDKTLAIEENEIILEGDGHQYKTAFKNIQKISEDDAHYYIYTAVADGIIVPFAAFSSNSDKDEFLSKLKDKVLSNGGKIQ